MSLGQSPRRPTLPPATPQLPYRHVRWPILLPPGHQLQPWGPLPASRRHGTLGMGSKRPGLRARPQRHPSPGGISAPTPPSQTPSYIRQWSPAGGWECGEYSPR